MQKLSGSSFFFCLKNNFKYQSKNDLLRTTSFIGNIGNLQSTNSISSQNRNKQQQSHQRQRHPSQQKSRQQRKRWENKKYMGYVIFGTSLAACGAWEYYLKQNCVPLSAKEQDDPVAHVGRIRSDLPEFGNEEIRNHDTLEKGVWVTYKDGVYDITKFIATGNHPGGDKIYMAAGGAVEPFWQLYAVHKGNPEILLMLEEYRIGNLATEERDEKAKEEAERNANDPFLNDPKRHPLLIPASKTPFNAEPPPKILADNFITPNEMFYVRNHLPVPDVDPDTYELEIELEGVEVPLILTLEDLKTKFEKVSVTSAVQCAGNRRSEMNAVKPLKGLPWGRAAIGNATWSGAKLKDVLKWAGVTEENLGEWRHLHLNGLDEGADGSAYAVSIPISKALSSLGDCILAYEMNGEPIPRDHGFPVRAIVPGNVGARNVKWLGQMVVSSEESEGHWQANDYKGFSPCIDWHNVDFTSAPSIQELPVQSAICDPEDGDLVKLDKNGKLSLKGYAWSGGGRGIVRVDVSINGGKTWQIANLIRDEDQEYNRQWAWTLWQIVADVPAELDLNGPIQICVKAVDTAYNVQPEEFGPIWNLRGVLSNAWHKIQVNLQK